MSHVATVNLKIRDLAALRAACESIGLEFREGQTSYRWFGENVGDYTEADSVIARGMNPEDLGKCTHAIAVPGSETAYEIGLVADGDAFSLAWDFFGQFGRELEAVAGRKCSTLVQAYAGEVAARTLFAQGFTLGETIEGEDGSKELVFERL